MGSLNFIIVSCNAASPAGVPPSCAGSPYKLEEAPEKWSPQYLTGYLDQPEPVIVDGIEPTLVATYQPSGGYEDTPFSRYSQDTPHSRYRIHDIPYSRYSRARGYRRYVPSWFVPS